MKYIILVRYIMCTVATCRGGGCAAASSEEALSVQGCCLLERSSSGSDWVPNPTGNSFSYKLCFPSGHDQLYATTNADRRHFWLCRICAKCGKNVTLKSLQNLMTKQVKLQNIGKQKPTIPSPTHKPCFPSISPMIDSFS